MKRLAEQSSSERGTGEKSSALAARNLDAGVEPWNVLECSRGLVSVRAAWEERLGEYFAGFRAAFLQTTSRQAASYPCPAKCGCAHLVQHLKSARSGVGSRKVPPEGESIVACCVCEDNTRCAPLELLPADLALWEVSWTKISQRLCRAFDLRGQPEDLGILNTRQIGIWSNDSVPAILTMQSERVHFRATILELVSRLRGKFILFAPTARNMDALSQEMLARAGAGFFALSRVARLEGDGKLTARESPGVLFAAFTPQPRELEADAARRAFALIQQLEGGSVPSVMKVFQLHCMESLSVRDVARRCRCSPATVANRLAVIREKTGLDPSQLRAYSPHLQNTAEGLEDSRARRVYRPSAITEDYEEEM